MGKFKKNNLKKFNNGPSQSGTFLSKNKKRKEKRKTNQLNLKKMDNDEFIPVKKLTSILKNKKSEDKKSPNFKQTGESMKNFKQTDESKKGFKQTTESKKGNNFLRPLTKPGQKKSDEEKKNIQNPKIQNKKKIKPGKPIPNKSIKFNEILKKSNKDADDKSSEGDFRDDSSFEDDSSLMKLINSRMANESDASHDSDAMNSDDDSESDENASDIDGDENENINEESDDSDDDIEDEEDVDSDDNSDQEEVDEDDSAEEDDDSGEDDLGSDDEDESDDDEDDSDDIEEKSRNNSTVHPNKIKGKKEDTKSEKKSSKDLKEKNSEHPLNSTDIVERPSEYMGFISNVPKNITEEQIKTALSEKISKDDIVSLKVLNAKSNNKNQCFVYISNENSLEKILYQKFEIGDASFLVHKARDSKKEVKDRPAAFLPRVPFQIKEETIKKIIGDDIGVENIQEIKCKNFSDKFQARNIVLYLSNEDSLKKMMLKGSYNIDGTDINIREAYESSCKIPMYRVVFKNIPENVPESVVRKEIEKKVGKGSVIGLQYSFKTKSYAFVSLLNEEMQKKALSVGKEITVKGNCLEVMPFKPRLPSKKRGPKRKSKEPSEVPAKKSKNNDNADTENSKKEENKTKLIKNKSTDNQKPNKKQVKINSPKNEQIKDKKKMMLQTKIENKKKSKMNKNKKKK